MTHTESFWRGRIIDTILSTTAVPFSLRVSKLPVSGNQFLTINPDTNEEEILFYTTTTWTAGEAGSIQITGRGYNVADAVQNTGNNKEHDENSEFKLALNHIIINQKVDMLTDNIVESEIKFQSTTKHGIVFNNMTTVQRDAIAASNGNAIYNTTDNVLQQYISGAWSNIGSTGVADASETVAGKVEMATNAEAIAGTDTGSTWAPLVTTPSQLVSATPSASETVEGLVERATVAEALAGTDETRYVNSKQMKDNYNNISEIASIPTLTFDDAAQSDVTITHSLWKIPKYIELINTPLVWIWCNNNWTITSYAFAQGVGDSSTSTITTNQCLVAYRGNNWPYNLWEWRITSISGTEIVLSYTIVSDWWTWISSTVDLTAIISA